MTTSRSCLIRSSVVGNDQVHREILYKTLLEVMRELDWKQLHLDSGTICILPNGAYMYGLWANRHEERNTAIWVIGWRGTGRKDEIIPNGVVGAQSYTPIWLRFILFDRNLARSKSTYSPVTYNTRNQSVWTGRISTSVSRTVTTSSLAFMSASLQNLLEVSVVKCSYYSIHRVKFLPTVIISVWYVHTLMRRYGNHTCEGLAATAYSVFEPTNRFKLSILKPFSWHGNVWGMPGCASSHNMRLFWHCEQHGCFLFHFYATA